jgi:nucleotide-binding universal stress UspA family protein
LVYLLRVVPEVRTGTATGTRIRPEAEAYLEEISDALRGDGLQVTTLVRSGDPPTQILEAAQAIGADLIVMVTHARAGLPRTILPSVAEEVLGLTRVPVALLRPGGRSLSRLNTLLVPLDGTPGGSFALRTAAGLAHATGARIVLLQVAVPVPAWLSADGLSAVSTALIDPMWDPVALQAAETYTERLAHQLGRADVRAEGRAALGDVASAINQVAEQEHADLIVMSSHSLTGPARTVLGSVADAVVRTAVRPVLVVRRDHASDRVRGTWAHAAAGVAD